MSLMGSATSSDAFRWLPLVETSVHVPERLPFSPPRTSPPRLNRLFLPAPAGLRTGHALPKRCNHPHQPRTARIQIP